MLRRSVLLLALPLFSCLAACAGGSMRVVQETPSGGTVAVQGDGREKAEQYMGSQCPLGYDILGESRTTEDQRTIRYSCRLPAPDDAKAREVKEVAVHI
jgi:hypothetical protein